MKNCGFRNAVIGKNDVTAPVWPVLNESNYLFKKRNRQIATTQSSLNSLQSFGYSPSSSQLNYNHASPLNCVEGRDECQVESNFPELSKSVSMKKDMNITPIHSICDNKLYLRKENLSASRRIRVPKFRNEISISLASLIKPRVVKNTSLYKKRNTKTSILCGNKLDGDRPVRKKGKSRQLKRKYLTRHKKDIILSRSLQKRNVYNTNFQKAKCVIPNMLNNLNVEKLEMLLGSLHIEEWRNEGPKISTKELAQTVLHSKKFKKYCNNLVTTTLLKNVETLIVRLKNLQDKQHAKDPTKTFAKRRYLCGFRETKRFILCDSVKAVIVATDLEIDLDLPSGLPLNEIKHLAEERSIPIVFAGKVKQLSYWTTKKHKISIISILRYEGAEQHYNDFIKSWEESKKSYEKIIKEIDMHLPKRISSKEEISQDVEQEIRDNIISKLSSDIVDFDKSNK